MSHWDFVPRRTALSWILFLGLAFGLSVQSTTPAVMAAEDKVPRLNVLLLVSDDQRPDTLSCLEASPCNTPHLDRLADRGTLMTRALAAYPICTPSRAELLTGCHTFDNGVYDFGRKFRGGVPFWARTFSDAGYRTGYVGKWHNAGKPSDAGFAEAPGLYAGGGGRWFVDSVDWNGRPVTGYRGWIFQTEERQFFPEKGVGLTRNISADFADAAIGFIEQDQDRPFFLQVNFTAPHDPLLIPGGYETMYDWRDIPLPPNFLPQHPFDHGNYDGRDEQLFPWPRTPQVVREELAAYYAVISHLDAQIGRILKSLDEAGQTHNTIVIFTSDHGLAVGSHGLRGKQNMYEHTVGVPLILAGPGVPVGQRFAAQCYLRDLFPTACDLVGLTPPADIQGKSLQPVLKGDQQEIHELGFAYFRNVQRMIRTDRWKYAWYPEAKREQLFDLQQDPFELSDLSQSPEHADTLGKLRERMLTTQKAFGDPLAASAPPPGTASADN